MCRHKQAAAQCLWRDARLALVLAQLSEAVSSVGSDDEDDDDEAENEEEGFDDDAENDSNRPNRRSAPFCLTWNVC